MLSGKELKWLELIFNERFGPFFFFKRSNGYIALCTKNSSKTIKFCGYDPAFYKFGHSDMDVTYLSEISNDIRCLANDDLVAPCSSKLSFPLVCLNDEGAVVHYDLLGLIYWNLNRLEEFENSSLDIHSRFPAVSSHAYRSGYLERPIVDEWLMVMRVLIAAIWPQLKLNRSEYKLNLTHDVDNPSLYAQKTWYRIFRMMAGNLFKRHDFRNFAYAPYIKLSSGKKISRYDPYNTFDWIMDLSDSIGVKSTFYFVCDGTNQRYDPSYNINDPLIRNIIKSISLRGHKVGLHTSYDSFNNPEKIKSEVSLFRKILQDEKVKQSTLGARQHYLRWSSSDTARYLDYAGLDYDSSVGFADHAGFRCGTCFEFPMFDVKNQKVLNLREKPLVTMEGSVLDTKYMNYGYNESTYEYMNKIKKNCIKYGGTYTLLWHNSYLSSLKQKQLYKRIIGG